MRLFAAFPVAAALLMPSLGLAAGGEVGNGGDVVRCAHDASNAYDGYYSLDYMLTLRTTTSNVDLVQVRSWDESVQRIRRNLQAKDPDLAAALDDFVRFMDNFDDYRSPRIWEEAAYGNVDIHDERIIRRIPTNCYTPGADATTINIIQAVIRKARPEQTVYQYDRGIYEDLFQHDPLQFSFLMIHEWLWDLTGDVEVIRTVNRLLHSTQLDEFSSQDLKLALKRIGLVPGTTFQNVCSRSPAIKRYIENQVGSTCDQITSLTQRFTEHQSFFVMNDDLPELNPGDLSGLPLTPVVAFESDHLHHVGENAFQGLVKLHQLDLSKNDLSALSPDTLAPLAALTELNLSENQLTSLPPTLFASNTLLYKIDLSKNQLKELPLHVFDTARVVELDLSGNQLVDIPADLAFRDMAKINVSRNHLTEPLSNFIAGRTIGDVRMGGNAIHALSPDFWKGLKIAQSAYIDLGSNSLSLPPDGILSDLTCLVNTGNCNIAINLSNNPIPVAARSAFQVACDQLGTHSRTFCTVQW